MNRPLRTEAWYGGSGPQRLRPPLVDEARPAGRRLRRQADDRHLQLGQRPRAVQRPSRPRWPSTSSAGVWEAGGVPLEFPVMSLGETQIRPTAMLLPEPDEHGRRGVDQGQPDRRRRPPVRLRQDHAGDADGRGVGRPSGHRRVRRPDAHRHVRRASHRIGHRRLAAQRGGPSRARCRSRSSSPPSRA